MSKRDGRIVQYGEEGNRIKCVRRWKAEERRYCKI